ncbi:spore coat protein [Alkaliphilus crotonatoxidans]
MQDKDMVNDVLTMTKAGLTDYTRTIGEASNQSLRQMLQQMRNSDEQFQYSLYQLAEQKGYYKPASSAPPQEVQQVKSELSQGMNNIPH